MVNSMQAAVIKKDFMGIVSNKQLFISLLIVPFVFTVIFPAMFILMFYFIPEGEMGEIQELFDLMVPAGKQFDDMNTALISLILNYMMPMFFLLIPILASTIMAASSFVGEKEKRTLETLLYCPLSLKQIFHSKVWASFLLSMTVSFASFFVMIVTVETGAILTAGSMLLPDLSWLVMMLLVSPAVSLLAITLIVGGSAKAKTVEESQTRSLFLIMPLMLVIVVQFTGVIFISALYLLIFGAVLAALAFVFMKRSMRKFTYELLLK